MKKRLVLVFLLALVLTVFVIKVGTYTATAADNVTYTLPFIGVSTNNVVYCWASNMSNDNVTVWVSTMANTLTSAPPDQVNYQLGGMIIYAKQSNMITFTGATTTLGSAVADLSQQVGTNPATLFGAALTFIGSYNGVTTTIITAGPNTVFGPQVTTTMSTNGLPTVPLSCLNMGLACYQGTTSPKRNLVGYSCMDSINTYINPISY
ncbi:MAG: hypothetical protein HQK92_01820 [Nitrospirae bacterium]|nr:hypothetical protein [Nitrospirota bacterium]